MLTHQIAKMPKAKVLKNCQDQRYKDKGPKAKRVSFDRHLNYVLGMSSQSIHVATKPKWFNVHKRVCGPKCISRVVIEATAEEVSLLWAILC